MDAPPLRGAAEAIAEPRAEGVHRPRDGPAAPREGLVLRVFRVVLERVVGGAQGPARSIARGCLWLADDSPEIVTTLLNLAEFCEHDEKPLPVDIRTLGMIAERCRAYAKALHYKETEFVSNPAGCVEAIIAINNQLQLPEAAMGVLVYAQAHLRLDIKEGWYEKLGRWDEALEAHARKPTRRRRR